MSKDSIETALTIQVTHKTSWTKLMCELQMDVEYSYFGRE